MPETDFTGDSVIESIAIRLGKCADAELFDARLLRTRINTTPPRELPNQQGGCFDKLSVANRYARTRTHDANISVHESAGSTRQPRPSLAVLAKHVVTRGCATLTRGNRAGQDARTPRCTAAETATRCTRALGRNRKSAGNERQAANDERQRGATLRADSARNTAPATRAPPRRAACARRDMDEPWHIF